MEQGYQSVLRKKHPSHQFLSTPFSPQPAQAQISPKKQPRCIPLKQTQSPPPMQELKLMQSPSDHAQTIAYPSKVPLLPIESPKQAIVESMRSILSVSFGDARQTAQFFSPPIQFEQDINIPAICVNMTNSTKPSHLTAQKYPLTRIQLPPSPQQKEQQFQRVLFNEEEIMVQNANKQNINKQTFKNSTTVNSQTYLPLNLTKSLSLPRLNAIYSCTNPFRSNTKPDTVIPHSSLNLKEKAAFSISRTGSQNSILQSNATLLRESTYAYTHRNNPINSMNSKRNLTSHGLPSIQISENQSSCRVLSNLSSSNKKEKMEYLTENQGSRKEKIEKIQPQLNEHNNIHIGVQYLNEKPQHEMMKPIEFKKDQSQSGLSILIKNANLSSRNKNKTGKQKEKFTKYFEATGRIFHASDKQSTMLRFPSHGSSSTMSCRSGTPTLPTTATSSVRSTAQNREQDMNIYLTNVIKQAEELEKQKKARENQRGEREVEEIFDSDELPNVLNEQVFKKFLGNINNKHSISSKVSVLKSPFNTISVPKSLEDLLSPSQLQKDSLLLESQCFVSSSISKRALSHREFLKQLQKPRSYHTSSEKRVLRMVESNGDEEKNGRTAQPMMVDTKTGNGNVCFVESNENKKNNLVQDKIDVKRKEKGSNQMSILSGDFNKEEEEALFRESLTAEIVKKSSTKSFLQRKPQENILNRIFFNKFSNQYHQFQSPLASIE